MTETEEAKWENRTRKAKLKEFPDQLWWSFWGNSKRILTQIDGTMMLLVKARQHSRKLALEIERLGSIKLTFLKELY